MANENRKIDENYKASMSAVTNDASQEIRKVRVNPTTNRVLVEQSALSSTLDSVKAEITGLDVSSGTYKEANIIDTGAYNALFTVPMDSGGTPWDIQQLGSDALSNSNNEVVTGSMNYSFNGTTWDRMRGSITDGLLVKSSPASKTQVVDASGNVIGSELSYVGEYALRTAVSQNIQLSAGNTSSVDLAYNATFTGIGEETYGFSAIQVFFYANQRCEIYIDQGSGMLTYELTDTYISHQNVAFTTIVTSVAPYFRIRIKNTSVNGEATTGLKLFTAMTPVIPVAPRKLSQRGNSMVDIEEWNGRFGHSVVVSPMGALRVAEATRLIGSGFVGATVDTNFWSKGTPTGSADWSQVTNPGSLTLATGATANSSIIVNSIRVARYVASSPNYYRGNIRVPAQTTGSAGYSTTIRFGAFDTDNGYFFQLVQTNPATTPTLSVVCRKATIDTVVTSGSFNGDYNNYYVVDTNCHTYEIHWTNKNAFFTIDDVLIHTFIGSTASLVDNQSLKIGLSITNSGGNTANNSFSARSSNVNRIGAAETRPMWKYQAGANTGQVLKYGPGSLHRVVCNKNTGTTITLYDALSATNPIGIIDPTSRDAIDYHLDFYTGLYLVTVGAGTDCTIVYE